MLFHDSNLVPVQILGDLTAKYIVNQSYPSPIDLEVDVTPTNTLYLNLFISNQVECDYRLLVEISGDRLKLIALGEMALDYVFLFPENDIFYAALFNQDNELVKLAWAWPSAIENQCPIPDKTFVQFNLDSSKPTFSLVKHAKSRGRMVIDMKLEAKGLKSNMRYWSLKNFLIPYAELVKTALLDNNPKLPPKIMEDALDYGFSFIEIGSLHALLEFNYRLQLYERNTELDNLTNLYLLLHSDNEEEIVEYLNRFNNKKIIPEYLKVLKSIINHDAGFTSKVATPHEELADIWLNRQRSLQIKNIVETKLPETAYEETVIGTLTCLDFEPKKCPVFTLHAAFDDQVYSGTIDPSLDQMMSSAWFQFRTKIYECTLRVTFTPESLKNAEQYKYTLLRIDELPDSD